MWEKIVSLKYVKPLLVMALCIVFHQADAQTVLPLEAGKVVYYDIVEADSLSREILSENAHRWLSAQNFASIADSVTADGYKLVANNQLPVYATGYVSKKQNGIVTYNLLIELKNGKYRYRFSDFVFHYYRENRNYKLISTGKTKPLEENTASGWQKTWEYNQKLTHQTINALIETLKKEMQHHPAAEKTTVAKEEKEW